MKKWNLVIFCLLISVLFANAREQDTNAEKELIKKVIQSAYVDGLCNNADRVAVEKGFHPGFLLMGVGQGNSMWKHPIYNWIESAEAGKAKGNKYAFQNEFTTVKYQFIDVSGNAAVAKIDFYEGEVHKFVDYISLLKFKDGWKIISKTFHKLPEKKTEEGR